MLGKIKRALGIEGVKLELIVNEPIDKVNHEVSGTLKFTTKSKATIDKIKITVLEKYTRGRRKQKLVNEYQISELYMEDRIEITPDEIIEIPFSIHYEIVDSEIEKMGKANIFARPIVSLAKLVKGVKSEFFVTAEAHVKGVKLHPFDKQQVDL